jgi:predicted dehydrogenase
MSVIKVGVVGFGHWGPNHVRVFSQLRELQVVSCADLDSKRLEVIREQHPDVRAYKDYHRMLREVEVDAVVAAASTKAHASIVQDALEAGKHVLCEKPMCAETVLAIDAATNHRQHQRLSRLSNFAVR